MVASEAELAGILAGTVLDRFEFGASPVCDGEEPVLVVGPIPSADAHECLEAARGHAEAAGRWPIWVCNFGTVVGEPVFWEAEFAAYSPAGTEITPTAIAERALRADEAQVLRERANRHQPQLEEELGLSTGDVGPSRSAVVAALDSGEIPSVGEIQRWALGWMLDNLPEDPSVTEGLRQGTLDYWHEEPDGHIFFLPTPDPWRATSYLNFYGSPGELSTLLLKKWFDKWDAKVVAHPGTMMNFDVGNPPTSLDDAAEVAWEHYLLAQCTTALPGIGLNEYTHALVGHPRWSLHEKP